MQLDAFDRVIVLHPNARLRGFSVRFSASSAWILSRHRVSHKSKTLAPKQCGGAFDVDMI
jgi:hypothetical protein